MDFALRGEGNFVEELEDDDQIQNHNHRHRPMSFSSTSAASPSSSSSQYRSINLMNSNAEMGSWLGTRFDPKAAALSDNLNPLSSSPTDQDTEPGDYASIEKEHMFDKVVTPSDVGKLNRLVIPKQHAEKYFPLDSSTNEKGLLLNFQDREGKPWRFRYSYWNSSQSYVMTKGWSRFVKEKKLDAGDIVSFQRGVGDAAKDRLFIDWRRRPDGPHDVGGHGGLMPGQYFRSIQYPWAATASAAATFSPPQLLYRPGTVMMAADSRRDWGGPGYGYGNVVYLRSNPPAPAASTSPIVFESVPVVQGNKAAAKRLRLFGVNMDCPVSESDEECEILSSTSISHASMVSQPPNNIHQFSSSPTTMQPPYPIPQLRIFNGTPLMSSKGKQTSTSSSSSMSLDFDIN